MKKVVLMVLLGMTAASFGITIDGSNADWTGITMNVDPDGDRPAAGLSETVDLREWAVTSDGTNLYSWFYADNFATYSADRWWASTHIDVDRSAGTGGSSQLSTNDSGGQFPDTSGPELGNNATENAAVFGPDIWAEYGPHIENGDEGFNFWGAGDNCQASNWSPFPAADTINSADQEGGALTAYSSTGGVEYATPISRIKSQLAGPYAGNGTPKKVWKIGVRFAAHLSGGGYDGDKSGNAADPAGSAATNKRTIYVPIDTYWGDTNDDGTVGLQDLSNLATNYGQTVGFSGDTWAMGDFNADGAVGLQDLSLLATYYGQTWSGAEVPEPVSLILLGLGAVGLIRRK